MLSMIDTEGFLMAAAIASWFLQEISDMTAHDRTFILAHRIRISDILSCNTYAVTCVLFIGCIGTHTTWSSSDVTVVSK